MKFREKRKDSEERVSLDEYLDLKEKEEELSCINNYYSRNFGMDYIISAANYHDLRILRWWYASKSDLENPEKTFDEMNSSFAFFVGRVLHDNCKINKAVANKSLNFCIINFNSFVL